MKMMGGGMGMPMMYPPMYAMPPPQPGAGPGQMMYNDGNPYGAQGGGGQQAKY